jgi:hypothetical protein
MNKRPVLFGMYPVAVAVMFVPMVDLIAGSWPLNPGSMSWRFGVLGLLMKSLLVPMMGLAFATLIAAFLEQRRMLRFLSVVGLLAAVLIVACTVTFALDFMQLRPSFVTAVKVQMDKATMTAVLIAGLVFPVALGIGIGGWKASRLSSVEREQMRSSKETGFLIRQTPPKESAT